MGVTEAGDVVGGRAGGAGTGRAIPRDARVIICGRHAAGEPARPDAARARRARDGGRDRRRGHAHHGQPAPALRNCCADAVAARAQRGRARADDRRAAGRRKERGAGVRRGHAGNQRPGGADRPRRARGRFSGDPDSRAVGGRHGRFGRRACWRTRSCSSGFLPTQAKARRERLQALAPVACGARVPRGAASHPRRPWTTCAPRSATRACWSSRASSRRRSRRSRPCRSPRRRRGSPAIPIASAASSC